MAYKINKQQLRIGKKVESEHYRTFKKLKEYQRKTGKCPSKELMYESIAKDHLSEDKAYYKKLRKAGL